MSIISILSFEIDESDINALRVAERASRSVIASSSFAADAEEALAFLRSSGNWLESALENLRQREKHVTALINQQTNAKLAVARLNPDVLRLAFTFVADMEDMPRYSRKNTWVILGHVCHVWRETLLGAAHLWARDLFSFPKGFSEILPRTRDALLNLNLFQPGIWSTDRALMEMAFPFLNRARLLVCYPTTAQDTLFMSEALFAGPIMELQKLQIIMRSKRSANFSIPHGILADHPKLRCLSMSDIFLRPSVCNELISLEICLENYNVAMMPSSATLLGILGKSPRLQTFTLRSWIEIPDGPITNPITPEVAVILPELTTLTLHLGQSDRNGLTPNGALERFLVSLRLPVIARADIAEFAWPNNIPAFESIINTIFTTCAGSPCFGGQKRLTATHGLHEEQRSLFQFELAEFRQRPRRRTYLRVSLQVSESTDIEDMARVASALNQAVHAHGVAQRIKCVDWSAHVHDRNAPLYWTPALARLDSVECIYIRADDFCPLTELIILRRRFSESSNSFLLPALRCIILDDRFLQVHRADVDLQNNLIGIYQLFIARKEAAIPIYTLGLEGVDVTCYRDYLIVEEVILGAGKYVNATTERSAVDEEKSEWGECGTSLRFVYDHAEVMRGALAEGSGETGI